MTTLEGHSLATLLNAEVIAIHQDSLGAQGRRLRVGPGDGVEVWRCALSGGRAAAVLLNRGADAPRPINVTWAELGLDDADAAPTTRDVRDVWAHADLGAFAGGYAAAAVPPTSAVVIVVSAAKE